jgi:AI-2 transport protein TqsA
MSFNKKVWLTEARLGIWSVAVIAAILISFALSYTRSILIPFVFALFFYFMLLPILRTLRLRLKFPRWLALAVTFLMVFLIMFSLGLFISTTVRGFIQGYEEYQAKVIIVFDHMKTYWAEKGYNVEELNIEEQFKNIPVLDLLKNTGFGVLNFVTKLLLMFIFLLFLFIGTKSSNAEDEKVTNEFMIEIDKSIRKYLITKLAASTVTAFVVGLFLFAMDLDFAFAFTVLVFVLNFIPTVGSIIATLLPLPVALIQFESPTYIFAVVAIPTVFQFTIGSVIEPKLMGDNLKLHPVVILISLMFWTLIWGIPGAFLAVPITAVVKIIFEKIEGGTSIANLMAGQLDEDLNN